MARGQLDTVLQHIRRYLGGTGARDLTDRQLLERFATQRDEAAFAVLVERHGTLVMSVCRRVLHQTQDAEDVFQATFLVLARKAASVRWHDSVTNWLYQAAYRLAAEARSKIARQRWHERQVASLPMAEAYSSNALQEVSDLLDEELQRLPVKYRSCLLLCYLEGHTRDLAAEELGWSLRTLERRLARGRDLLRKRLTQRGLSLSTALLASALASNASSAAVPSLLATSTARAAHLFAVEADIAGAISAQAQALAQGLLKSMALTSLKSAAALILLVSLVAAGAGVLIQQVPAVKQAGSGSDVPIVAIIDPDRPPSEREEPARKDWLGDELPPGALARMGTARLRHYGYGSGYVPTAFSPDSRILVSAIHNSAQLWSTTTGKLLTQIHDDTGVGSPTFSPDGKWLALTGGQAIKLWDPKTGQRLGRVPAEGSLEGQAIALAFSADSNLLAIAVHKREISLWDLATGKQAGSLDAKGTGGYESIYYLRFAPGGGTLVSMGFGRENKEHICHWDLATRTLSRRVDLPKRGGTVVLSEDGQTVAAPAGGGIVHIWDSRTAKQRCVLQGDLARTNYGVGLTHDGKVVGTAWAQEGREDATLSLWESATGKLIRRFPIPWWAVYGVQFSPDGHLVVTAGSQPAVQVWDTTTGKSLLNAESHVDMISDLAFTPDGRTLVSSDRFSLRLWDAATGRPQPMMHHRADQPPPGAPPRRYSSNQFALLPTGRLMLCDAADGLLHLQELDTGKEVRRLVLKHEPEDQGDRSRRVYPFGLAADGRTVVAGSSSDKQGSRLIHVWDLQSGQELVHRPDPSDRPFSAFSPDLKMLLRYRDVLSAKPITDPRAKAGSRSIEATEVVLEETATGRSLLVLRQPNHTGHTDAFTPDGQSLVTTTFPLSGKFMEQREGPSSLHLWELASGKEKLRITSIRAGYEFGYERFAFSPGGRILAGARKDRVIQLWDLATGKEVLRRTGYQAPIYCLTFSPDGKALASGHLDSTILVWDVARAAERLDRPRQPAQPQVLETWWTDLAGADAHKAQVAIWSLVGVPHQAVPLLRDRLKPVPTSWADQVKQLVDELDSKQFQRRETAARQLANLADQAEPALQDALKHALSPEQRRRIDSLLSVPRVARSPDLLRSLRALQVLEHIGDTDARHLLADLANGAANARLTQEAKAALDRLAIGPIHRP